jgi:hypothetical protein
MRMKSPAQIKWVIEYSYTIHYDLIVSSNSSKSLTMKEDLIVVLKLFTTL